ncbi:MBL fold metallo-hydrolase [bacterium]|nr:MBL fold metallo-hydrolase [bacterium]
MKIFVLGSSSRGNSTFCQLGSERFLVDIGFSYSKIRTRLSEKNIDINTINGIFITHEHQDHTKGLSVFLKNHNIPLYISKRSYYVLKDKLPENLKVVFINDLSLIKGKNYKITPFYLTHDSVANFGFFMRDDSGSLLIIYDTGDIPKKLLKEVSHLDILVIETNHDIEMLMGSKYPWYLKQRIMSSRGHLSNEQAFDILRDLVQRKTGIKYIFPMHLSEENNHMDIVKKVLDPQFIKDNKITLVETFPESSSEVISI